MVGCLGFGTLWRKSVDMTLLRLSDATDIRHLARGLYDPPERHKKLGLIRPAPDAIAQALGETYQSYLKTRRRLRFEYLLKLSTRFPAHLVQRDDTDDQGGKPKHPPATWRLQEPLAGW